MIRSVKGLLVVALLAFAPGAYAQGPKTPSDWVAQLGADNLKDRDAASAALTSLGTQARDAVRDGLTSKDAEVQSRSKELWKTLRWMVVPDSGDDTKKLVAEAEAGSVSDTHWQDFVQRHGAESLRLVAEFREDATRQGANAGEAQTADLPAAIYKGGLRAVLENVSSIDIARFIAQTNHSTGRDKLDALLADLQPAEAQEKTAVAWMELQIALWNYRAAWSFGREYALRNASHPVVKLCAIAVDRGGMFNKIQQSAQLELAAGTDPNQLCARQSFYTGVFVDLEKKEALGPLLDTVRAGATAGADDASLRRLVETLMSAGLPERAVKALHNVRSPEALYMRSAADIQMQNEPAAGADWGDTLNALDDMDDSKKKETFYSLGEMMLQWHDDRSVVMWQKILATKPADTVYDANACFRMGEYLEAEGQFANAADFYQRGLTISSKLTSSVMIATTSDGKSAGAGPQAVLDKIRDLKSRAAGQKSLFDTPSAGSNQQ